MNLFQCNSLSVCAWCMHVCCILRGMRQEECVFPPLPPVFLLGWRRECVSTTTVGRLKYTVSGSLCVCVHVCVRVCVRPQENDSAKKQTGWFRCPLLQPIGSLKMHHSCPPANPGLPCGAGISLEDCYLAKCSQANDGQGPRDGSEMWSLNGENFMELFYVSGRQTYLLGSLSV